jgi:hypothetical protein
MNKYKLGLYLTFLKHPYIIKSSWEKRRRGAKEECAIKRQKANRSKAATGGEKNEPTWLLQAYYKHTEYMLQNSSSLRRRKGKKYFLLSPTDRFFQRT